MQHITDFPLDAVHLYRQPQHSAVTEPQLKIVAFLDPYMKLAYCESIICICCGMYVLLRFKVLGGFEVALTCLSCIYVVFSMPEYKIGILFFSGIYIYIYIYIQ